jgi:6-phosphogluconolactonase
MQNVNLKTFPDLEALSQWAAEEFTQLANQAIAKRGRFLTALSGGSTPQRLYELLVDANIDWSHTFWFWGDERCVSPDDSGSNYHQAYQTLLSHVSVPSKNILRIKGELPPQEAADDYAKVMEEFRQPGLAWPSFDLVLLGMGDDGHTASLFPWSDPAIETGAPTLAVNADYEGRPAQRVTLTSPVFNAARQVFFLVSGDSKAETLAQVLNEPHKPRQYPAQRIHPANGQVTWLVDEAAAKELE